MTTHAAQPLNIAGSSHQPEARHCPPFPWVIGAPPADLRAEILFVAPWLIILSPYAIAQDILGFGVVGRQPRKRLQRYL